MFRVTVIRLCPAISLLALCGALQAQTWQLGVAVESSRSPFIDGQRRTSPLLLVNYIGERLSVVNGKLSWSLAAEEGQGSYLAAQWRPRQFYSARLDSGGGPDLPGMARRSSALEAGLGHKREADWGKLVVEGLADVSGAHKGYAATATYSHPWQFGPWLLEPALGVQVLSARLVDYYHGVRADEARDDRPAYRAGRAVNGLAGLKLGYAFNARTLGVLGMEQLALGRSISNSPIVAERQLRKVYLGLVYTFAPG